MAEYEPPEQKRNFKGPLLHFWTLIIYHVLIKILSPENSRRKMINKFHLTLYVCMYGSFWPGVHVPLNPQGRAIILKGKRSISEGLFRFLHCSPYLPAGIRGGPYIKKIYRVYRQLGDFSPRRGPVGGP